MEGEDPLDPQEIRAAGHARLPQVFCYAAVDKIGSLCLGKQRKKKVWWPLTWISGRCCL